MYTVVRFVAGVTCSDATLTDVGSELNTVAAGTFKRLDRIGRRFSISVSSADNWDVHVNEVLTFIRRMSKVIAHGRAKDISIVADIAVEPEDLNSKPYLSCDMSPTILSELAQNGVGIIFTFCALGDTS
jgi:hypothetical protein